MTHKKAMESLPSSADGALVVAREWIWRRTGAVRFGAVTRVRLAPGAPDAPDLDTLLEPFDRLRALDGARRVRKVSTAFLQRWVAEWPALAWPALPIAAPVDLPIALLPHQLSPALAVVRGSATRLLLADAVGQGKTVEAGLILRELAARGAADRVLVLTPITLRDQWRTELASRCRLEAEVIDRVTLRARDRHTPAGLSPFQAPGIFVLSIDLAKQPDVLARLVPLCWDVLVIDEAHGVSGDSARTAAAEALGARSRIVLLLTATPHAGDAEAFARLCAIGRLGDDRPPMWFRHRPARDGRPRIGQGPRHLSETIGRGTCVRRGVGPLRPATGPGRHPRGAACRPGPSQARVVEPSGAGGQSSASHRVAGPTRRAGRTAVPALQRGGNRTRRRPAPGGAAAAWTGRRGCRSRVADCRARRRRTRRHGMEQAACTATPVALHGRARPGVHGVPRHADGARRPPCPARPPSSPCTAARTAPRECLRWPSSPADTPGC